jgi:hypothetical protein
MRQRRVRRRLDGFHVKDSQIRLPSKSAHRPATTRSEGRLGDRFRERLRISSLCLTSTDSATTERAPPGPASRATVASRQTASVTARTPPPGELTGHPTPGFSCEGVIMWMTVLPTRQSCRHRAGIPCRRGPPQPDCRDPPSRHAFARAGRQGDGLAKLRVRHPSCSTVVHRPGFTMTQSFPRAFTRRRGRLLGCICHLPVGAFVP